MRRTKGIDELYEEVREFEIVITNDAALATALNARIDKPFVGYFALTPKQIAAYVASRVMDEPLMSELRVISALSDATGLSLKYVHSEVENIREIRKYTCDVKKHLHSAASNEIFDNYEHLPTLERLMGAFVPDEDEFFKDHSVAVIGVEFFNDLDKHFIPLDFEPISIFAEEEYQIPTIYEIGNDRQLAENAVDLIDPQHPTDFAIVLNTSSPIVDAVRASMYRRRMPFINALNVRDLSQIRDYLQFITLAMEFDTIRVKNVKELFSNYNGFFKKGREEFLLCKQGEQDMTSNGYKLWTVMRDIRSMTFGEVSDVICDRRARIQVNILIEDLNVKDSKITSNLLSEVKYAVDNVKELHHNEEIPEDEKKGVLLVDCNNSVYIDRPVVIYLGMEQDWNKSIVGKKYIDIEEETENNVHRLEALLQQGNVQYYLVNSTKNGKPARPSMLFDLLYGKPMDSFSLMSENYVKGRWHQEISVITPEDPDRSESSESDMTGPFSKSSFNAYYSCPRKYMYNAMLTTPDEKSTEFGTLIHAFAEFYICYPEDVRQLSVGHFVDLISDRYSGLSSPLMESLDTDKITKAMSAVMEYIDHLGIRDVPLDIKLSDKSHPNGFMVAMGKEFTSSVCEKKIRSERYPLYGYLDLLWDGTITDYKTGKPSEVDDIVNSMIPDSGAKYPEFQAPIYLAMMEELEGNGRFNLFYAMDNDVTSSVSDVPIVNNVRKISLFKGSVKQCMVSSNGLRAALGLQLSKDYREHADVIMDAIGEMGSESPSDWSEDEGLRNTILSRIGLNPTGSNHSNLAKALNKVAKHCRIGIVFYGNSIEIPQDTLKGILEEIVRYHSKMVEQSSTEFPAEPRIGCEGCNYLSVCTKDIIESIVGTGGETHD